MVQLRPLWIPACPFANLPESRSGRWGEGLTAEKMKECVWVRPELVRGDRVRGVDAGRAFAACEVCPVLRLGFCRCPAFVPLLLHLGMKPGGITSHRLPDGFGPLVRVHVVQTIPDSV
jgi:hypothetical protein